jgi:DNA-binding NtrC family response regulator
MRSHGLSPLASGFPVGDVTGDFVKNQLQPLAELFVVVHPICLKDLLDRLEVEIIRSALVRVKGNVRKAAALLGVKYTTLYFKVQKHRIQPVLFETLNP